MDLSRKKQDIDMLDTRFEQRQINTLLKAGVPIMRALNGLQESATNPAMKEVIRDVRESLEAGRELSVSLARHPKVFSSFYISMVRVGEATGLLDEIFLRLFEHLEFERFMREQVKSALRYPMFVVIAMAVAIVVVNLFVIPAFAKVFQGFGAELPLMTRLLLGFSDFMVTWWPAMLVALIGGIVAFRAWVGTHAGRMQWEALALRFPIAGKIVSKAAMARFARSFALSTRSGVPVMQALSNSAQTVDNSYIAAKIEGMRDTVERGESVLRASIASGFFTPVVLQMVAVGEESGALDDMMEEVGQMYQREVEYELKTLGQQIEPILIVCLGALVLILALGIFLPMWDLGKVAIKR
jgi:MSHA biogenesis protein MshG